jgi:hypothetical protein
MANKYASHKAVPHNPLPHKHIFYLQSFSAQTKYTTISNKKCQ